MNPLAAAVAADHITRSRALALTLAAALWYLRDPAGSFVELYSDMDVIDDDDEWERTGRTTFGFEHVANSWGPDIPVEFIVPGDLDVLQAAWAKRS